jgi:hypothetical protein
MLYSKEDLEKIRYRIEKCHKTQLIDIYKILEEDNDMSTINSNKNGLFIDISLMTFASVYKVEKYLDKLKTKISEPYSHINDVNITLDSQVQSYGIKYSAEEIRILKKKQFMN